MDDLRLKAKAVRLQSVLEMHYGRPTLKTRRDPLSELILTILTQNTSDTNSGRAYRALIDRYATWDEVMNAPTDQLAETIRSGGLANVKAPRIQRILCQLQQERGELSLGFLEDATVEEARKYLLSLYGVGPKTAACVLLFAMHKAALPVDTHVHRVSKRVGLVPDRISAEKAHTVLEMIIAPEEYYPFHLLFIQHGRVLCKAQRPLCVECPIKDECVYLSQIEDAFEPRN